MATPALLSRWLDSGFRVRTVSLAFLLVNALVYVDLSTGTPICFDDCLSYIVLMDKGSVREYLETASTMFRSWFVPVFFSLFGKYTLATASTIALTQSVLLYVSWVLFAWAISGLFEGWISRATFLLVCLSMYAHQYYVLNRYLLSDSLAMSTALGFLATAIAFGRIAAAMGRWWAIALLVVAALFATGTRDSNMALVVMGAVYVAIAHRSSFARRHLIAAALGLGLVVANQVRGSRSRQDTAMLHLLAGFVLPTEPVRQFFVAHGMPAALAERGASFTRQPWCSADVARLNEYLLAVSPPVRDLRRASRIWGLWLATHPRYVLAQAYADVDCILGQSFATSPPFANLKNATADVSYARPGVSVVAIQQGAKRLAPSDFVGVKARVWIALASALVLGASLRRRRRGHVLATLFLVAAGLSNAVAAYFAELWQPSEMMRHALLGAVVFDVGFLVSLASVAALVLERRASHPRDAADPAQRTSSPG